MPLDFADAYEALNPADDDYRFYAELARSLDARRVLDLGCGTGVLAMLLAADGREVTGIDPDPDMLAVARAKGGADVVTWVEGYADRAATGAFDLAVMSGHVAQLFLTDEDWAAALGHLRRALRPGGVLAFESRHPDAREWESWTRDGTLRRADSADGTAEFWHETVAVDLPLVTYDSISRDLATGREERTRNVLAFRTETDLRESLGCSGFGDLEVYGSWDRSPLGAVSREIIVVGRVLPLNVG